MGKLALRHPSARVVQVLGPPGAVCTAGSLEHLREHLPQGFAPAAQEQTIGRMQRETAERWIYPLRRNERARCTPRQGATEVGLDRNRRILWYVPVTGRTEVVLPDEYLPEGSGASK